MPFPYETKFSLSIAPISKDDQQVQCQIVFVLEPFIGLNIPKRIYTLEVDIELDVDPDVDVDDCLMITRTIRDVIDSAETNRDVYRVAFEMIHSGYFDTLMESVCNVKSQHHNVSVHEYVPVASANTNSGEEVVRE